MSIDQIIVLIVAALAIGGIYWFFLGKRPSTAVKATDEIEIVVDGGYTPEVIEVAVGKPTTLHFFRKDPSTCLEEVVISDLKIRKTLTLNERTDITITPPRTGTLRFSCGMGMFHGTIIVK
jgi:plastocyanin domain-containing protein